MSSLALMRWLEGTPERYDAGMRALTFGQVGHLHAAVAEAAAPEPGARVLEIGCGTGTVTALLRERGARVTALDQAPEMLEIARKRLGSDAGVEWREQTAAEIDALPEAAYDAVVLSLCLSDMSRSERAFVLREAVQRLSPGGRLVVGDEVIARGALQRGLQRVWRLPQASLAWLVVGSVSRPIGDLTGELQAAGVEVGAEQHWLLGSLALVVGERAG